MIRIEEIPFDPWALLRDFTDGCTTAAGAITSFVGLVRDLHETERVTALTLEHYPGMTEKQMAVLEADARARWPLESVLIVHRVGRMLPAEPIVLIAVASAHRDAAFDACRFLIDWVKTQAPFWKHEETPDGGLWVESKKTDAVAAKRWTLDSSR